MSHIIFVAGSQLGTNERLCFLAIVHCAHDSYGSLRLLRSKFLQSTLNNSGGVICEGEDGECVHCGDEDGEGYIEDEDGECVHCEGEGGVYIVRVRMVCVCIVRMNLVCVNCKDRGGVCTL